MSATLLSVVRPKRNAPGALAGLHLMAGGTKHLPVVRGLTARFLLPMGTRNLVLASLTARPCDVGDSNDDRNLGVCLERMMIDDGFGTRQIAVDDPRLVSGLHEVEEGPRRWTSGRTPLPDDLFGAYGCDVFFLVQLAGEPLAR